MTNEIFYIFGTNVLGKEYPPKRLCDGVQADIYARSIYDAFGYSSIASQHWFKFNHNTNGWEFTSAEYVPKHYLASVLLLKE